MATIAAGAAAGTGGSVGATLGTGDDDDALFVTVTAGSSGVTTGILCTITLNDSWSASPGVVGLRPKVTVTAMNAPGFAPTNGLALGVLGAAFATDLHTLNIYTAIAPTINLAYSFSVVITP